MKFQTNPIIVEAVQVFATKLEEVEEFVGGDLEVRHDGIVIATPNGPLHARPFDWIVKHSVSKFSVVSNELFKSVFSEAAGSN